MNFATLLILISLEIYQSIIISDTTDVIEYLLNTCNLIYCFYLF
jgi:hypothetical protein